MTSAATAGILSGSLRVSGTLHGVAEHGTAAGHVAIVVTSSTPLWYATRATGLVALVLLTAGMALGLLTSVRYEHQRWPRFITIGLHRSMSLLACAFTAVHITTTVLDSFVPIGVADVFVPFISGYRPIWLGLGAIATDLLIALTVTSLLRARLSYRTWKLVHWAAYLCWPVAVLHGLGSGSDVSTRWVLALTLCCVGAIVCLIAWRLTQGWPSRAGLRIAGAITLVIVLIAAGAWLMGGPLKPGWSHRAGKPSSVLAVAVGARSGTGGAGSGTVGPALRLRRFTRWAARDRPHLTANEASGAGSQVSLGAQ
jgi:sulfoxide reductase heme-binding subunit YedZ